MTTAFVSRTDRKNSGALPAKSLARKIPDWINDPQSYQAEGPKKSYRTVFISDVHLGTPGCSATQLVDFLHSFECETLYLVGDIVDGWQIRRGWYWPSSHNDVIRSILKFARRGTRVIYIPGNHDEAFRDYTGLEFGGVEMVEEDIHETADGRRLLVLHGDKFDGVVLYAKWLAFLGDYAYTALLKANRVWNFTRRKLGLPYWSLSAYAKHRVKNAVNFIGRFEETVAHAAAEHGVDGVVCGHIHTAEIRQIGDIMYYNDGDWVESCTALVEDHAGALSLIDWRAETWERELAKSAGKVAVPAPGRAVATA
ncbi:UDP-2,3-diacylglucosamine diphosphatase [Sphingomonas panni]|uniref:UDP-2,3-diacylglucosamine diphosphatase n=1 Tax=Sphingomonas panni TaxID=237612 RepID=UPI001F5BC8A6|nr:UDP-2,3-diacylglucosamine diphosphatase [Sphingomonas panni]